MEARSQLVTDNDVDSSPDILKKNGGPFSYSRQDGIFITEN